MNTNPYPNAFSRKLGKLLFTNPLVAQSEWALRGDLNWRGAKHPPAKPSKFWPNAVLKSRQVADQSVAHAFECGLPPHQDGPKNWDSLTAIRAILDATDSKDRVLDAGATLYSNILPWLYLFGYRELFGIDLIFPKPLKRGPIQYDQGDLTKTRFPDEHFGAITCMSVVEHGVDVEAYLKEMSRLLRPGGVLVTSTDYWDEGIETHGKVAYGVPIRFFKREDLQSFVELSGKYGFKVEGEVDLDCDERVVHWQGFDFTFACITLIKG
ncbi:MAG: class I SAM-dependent methyltransferase [Limisphaerales bacterium]